MSVLEDVIDVCDFVLIMSVNPGFGGQEFIPNALNKIRRLDRIRRERRLDFAIEIDGGVAMTMWRRSCRRDVTGWWPDRMCSTVPTRLQP